MASKHKSRICSQDKIHCLSYLGSPETKTRNSPSSAGCRNGTNNSREIPAVTEELLPNLKSDEFSSFHGMRVSNALECLRSHFLSHPVQRGSMYSCFSSRHIGHSMLVYQVPDVLSVLSVCKICVYHNWIWQSLSGRLSTFCCKHRGLV